MDRELLRQALSHHGPALLSLLRAEQHDNPDFRGLLPPPGTAFEPPRGAPQAPPAWKESASIDTEIKRFIAKKADLLFAHSWKPNGPLCETIEENEEYYAVMPPLERFMEVPREDRREFFFRDIERGDIVIGRITSIREFGFFMVLICLGSGIIREISDLDLTALCPLRDVPPQSNHGDPLSYYQTGDLIRAAVKDVDRYHEKLTVSLYSSALPPNLSSTKLGVITSDDFPLHYRRSLEVANTGETFEEVLHRSPGFANPFLVEYLAEKLGLSESNPPSLMRSLQIKNFSEEDFAPALRKKQSASWALKCVKAGVDYFKVGRHVEAMNEYNKALEIDPQNVEALVARGALYATKGSLNKAISDFEIALENCPTHRNARKYLCQTLVERGGQLEEEDKLLNAESYYKKALSLDETFEEAEEALTKLRKHMQKSLEMREKQAAKEERQKEKKVETSAEKLRKLLKEEKRLKKKRKISTSSSSSSSSSSSNSSSDVSISSSSSSSDHKKRRKKRRNRSESSRSSKKGSSRASSHYKDQMRKEEWYSPPADTSASFLNQHFEVEKLLERQDSLVCPKTEVKEKDRHCSFSRTSGDEEDTFGGRSEDSRDSYSSSRTLPSSSRSDKYGKADRFFSSRQGSSGSYHKSDEKPRMHYFRKFERDIEGRREHFRKHGWGQDRYYVSPSGSDYSGKSMGKYRSYSSTCVREGDRSYDSDRYMVSHHKNESETRKRDETSKTKEPDEETSSDCTAQTESGVKRNLPQNLVNIFNQIAEFEREKGSKQKKE
ncbi:tetratricopeptide repeat protein 14 isoform X1 [Colius striatus]|uniref:tetratricopeptide repeat protein 14 isoform X1 n=1 Tax=Colius striatus TaxID=57412 RepID=UPI002B1E2FF6|nr:tetratricopeptide repeat protein 14 isoform X1 [Colius striatus]